METKPSFDGGERIIIGSLILIFVAKLIEYTWKWLLSHPRYLYALIGCLSILVIYALIYIVKWIMKKRADYVFERTILGHEKDSAFCGSTDKSEDVWIKPRQRSMHTQGNRHNQCW